jgi:cellulose synthase/poly-beta-1,6-N-acetylglucosamine synthase-like glycosyltransferase
VPVLYRQAQLSGSDVVVASRYISGGDSGGLDSRFRRFVSTWSGRAAKTLFPRRLAGCSDPTLGVDHRQGRPVPTRSPLGTVLADRLGSSVTGRAGVMPSTAMKASWDRDPQVYDYFSQLTGVPAEVGGESVVRFRRVASRRDGAALVPLVTLTVTFATLFYVWLFLPDHLPLYQMGLPARIGEWVMVATTLLIEALRVLMTGTLCWSALRARDPIPMAVDPTLRVAFVTTIVPGKEPVDVVERTMRAARFVRHPGVFDLWICDEGDHPEVRAMCRRVGVNHFTRKGVPAWNTPTGEFTARTKHGNLNAWRAAHSAGYDVVMGVDPDHAPLPNAAERLLGYFRDPDVGFVCGPQVYGNARSFLTRCAESQAYVFQSVIQRAANSSLCAMFVGTNNAYRVRAFDQIGGFQDSITEDMATSLRMHGTANPMGNRWKSVYTPDTVAIGEGPTTWADYFSQQLRWARGADEIWAHGGLWGQLRRLRASQALHYLLMMSYYPNMAVTWLLGAVLMLLPVLTGVSGLVLSTPLWLSLYGNLAICQIGLYVWLRRFSISPHEPAESSGWRGLFLSAITAPLYCRAGLATVFNRKASFVVTPKGASASTDSLGVFRTGLCWTLLPLTGLALGTVRHGMQPGLVAWVAVLLVACLAPTAIWLGARRKATKLDAQPADRLRSDHATGDDPAGGNRAGDDYLTDNDHRRLTETVSASREK